MTLEQWSDEHGCDGPPPERALLGWCAQCKDPVFSDEKALEGQVYHGGRNPPETVLVHAECFREWVGDHIDDEELSKALDFWPAGDIDGNDT